MQDLDLKKQLMKEIETAPLDVDLIGKIIALKDYNYKDKELRCYLDEILTEKYSKLVTGHAHVLLARKFFKN